MIKKILIPIYVLSLQSVAQPISFDEAWKDVLNHSEILHVKKEDVNIAKYKQDIANDLDFPDIKISANYARVDKPDKLTMDDLDLSVDENSLGTILKGIASGAGSAAYNKAKAIGKSQTQAEEIAKNATLGIKSSFENIKNSLQNASPNLSKEDVFQSSISATWAIYTGGKIEAFQAISKEKINEAKELFKLSKQEQFEHLTKIYFSVVLLKEVQKTKDDMVRALEKHFIYSKKLFKHGQIAKIETLTAKSRLDKAKVDAQKAKRDYEVAQIALTNLLHKNSLVTTDTKLFTNKNLPNINTFLEKTLSLYPAINVLDSKKKQADELIKAKKGNYMPNLFLFGNYTIYKDDTLSSKMKPDWMAGVGAEYKLLDSKGRRGELNVAYSKKLKANYMYEKTKRDISVLVKKTYKSAQQALEEYEGLKSSIDLAKENLSLRKKSFSQGLGTSLDVIDAELFLQGAKVQRLSASYKYILSLSKLLSLSSDIDKFYQYSKTE